MEEDEVPEEYCGLEGSTVQEQLTIVSSRLDQREADYDGLKTELNKTKEECINLQGNSQINKMILHYQGFHGDFKGRELNCREFPLVLLCLCLL